MILNLTDHESLVTSHFSYLNLKPFLFVQLTVAWGRKQDSPCKLCTDRMDKYLHYFYEYVRDFYSIDKSIYILVQI